MHNLKVPFFFFTNNTRAPHGETLSLINPFYNNSSNWIFNSLSSVGAILYRASEMRCAPRINSIPKSISLLGGKPGNFSLKTSGNSQTSRIFSIFLSSSLTSATYYKYPMHPYLSILLAFDD